MSFRALVAGVDDRLEVIVRFLAVLELYKQGIVDLDQFETSASSSCAACADGESRSTLVSLDDWDDEPGRRRRARPTADAARTPSLDAMRRASVEP